MNKPALDPRNFGLLPFAILSLAALGRLACDDKSKDQADKSPATGTTTSASASAAPTVAMTAGPATAMPSATTVAAMASASASGAASAPGSAAGGPTTGSAVASAAPSAPGKPAGGVSQQMAGENFILTASAPGNCKTGAPCAMTMRLEAQGKFHINNEYPYKFVTDKLDGVDLTGKPGGDFHKDTETSGTLNLPFKASVQGKVKIAGTYKMSVCSEDKCQIETQRVSLDIPIL